MSYEEFGNLRFLDFFPRNTYYSEDEIGGTESGIGMACEFGYGHTSFYSPVSDRSKTAEIAVDFDNRCPEEEGNRLLERLGLRIRKGMSYVELKDALGVPIDDRPTYLVFTIGSEWPYCVCCFLKPRDGLSKVWIMRKDLADALDEQA